MEAEVGSVKDFTTIRDFIISPYEIDVDKSNFTLVRVHVSKPSTVAGKEREGGNTVRTTVGYFNTLAGAISRIAQEKVAEHNPDLKGQIVTLKQFLAKQEAVKKIFLAWAKYLNAPFTVTEADGLPVVSPADYLDSVLPKKPSFKKKKGEPGNEDE